MTSTAAIGIDFGTSYCRACLLRDDEHNVIEVPAVVGIDMRGHVLVGQDAERFAVHHPERTVFGVKRLLGRKLYSPEATWLAGASPVELVPGSNGDAWLRIGERLVSPQEIAAYLLRHVVGEVQRVAGEQVTRIVIATSAFFDVGQRRALLDAAMIAGLSIRRFVEASAAAVLALDLPSCDRVAVVDLGAGYLDVSVMHHRGGGWGVMAVTGDALLGGDDLDRRIVDSLIAKFFADHDADLTRSPRALHRLRLAAREVKQEATLDTSSHDILIPMIATIRGIDRDLEHAPLARPQLEKLWHDELEALWPPCADIFDDLHLGTDDMDELILLGGSTQVPAVQQLFEGLFRREALRPERWRTLAAIGAARIARRAGRGDELVQSVMPHTIGVKVRGGGVRPVIRRNQVLPCVEQKPFATSRADQASLIFEVFQGESPVAKDNLYLGRFEVSCLVASKRHFLRFAVDQCGLLEVTAGDEITGKAFPVEIHLSSGLAEAQRKAIEGALAPRTNLSGALGGPEKPPSPVPLSERTPHPIFPTTSPSSSGPPESDEPLSGPAKRPVRRFQTRSGASSMPPESGEPPSLPPQARRSQTPRVSAGPTAVIETMTFVGTTVAERYLVESVIGEGGMGRVYKAKHKILDKVFALKILHPELAANEVITKRFMREAQSAARIDSDHVIEILDFGQLDDGSSFIVMEFLEGVTLGRELESGALSAPDATEIGIQIARGLAAAHSIGIVHRDLKPNNIKIVRRKPHPLVKILDFGIAKSLTSDGEAALTLVSSIVGTPHYMAPEQVYGKVDGRTDIYALGILLYEMVTGEVPFDDESVALLLNKQRSEAPVPPRQHPGGEDCPPALEAVILRCLEKNPDQRFQTADALVAALLAV